MWRRLLEVAASKNGQRGTERESHSVLMRAPPKRVGSVLELKGIYPRSKWIRGRVVRGKKPKKMIAEKARMGPPLPLLPRGVENEE